MSKDARDKIAELIQRKYGKLIMKIAFEITGDYDVAEDVKQEVLYRCAMKHETLESLYEGQFYNYIVRAAKNTSINVLNKMKSEEEKMERYIEANYSKLITDKVDFKAFEERYGFSEEIIALLTELKPGEREILLMKYYMGFSNKEIAEYLQINLEAVNKRIQRARIRMKSRVVESEGDKLDER